MKQLKCPKCGSTNVVADALALWNPSTEDWELCGVCDERSCNDCGACGITPIEEYMKDIKCIVPAHNANGEPDLFFVIVRCTEGQYENGDHYEAAKEAAEGDGYEPVGIVYDEIDSAGKAMLPLFEWKTASEVII